MNSTNQAELLKKYKDENEKLKLALIPMNDYQIENGKYELKDYLRIIKGLHSCEEYVDLFEEKTVHLHNKYGCGNNRIQSEPLWDIPMEEVNKAIDSCNHSSPIDTELSIFYKIIKNLKQKITN